MMVYLGEILSKNLRLIIHLLRCKILYALVMMKYSDL